MRDYLSASAINLWLTCPTSYYLKYVLEMKECETDQTYANYGTLVHNINENIANGEYLFLEEAIEEYETNFPSTGMHFDNYYENGIEGIKHVWEFFEDFKIELVGAEVKCSVKPLEDVPKLFGFVDLIYRDENGKLIVRDYKTSKPYTEKQMEHQSQPYVYAEMCLAKYGELPAYFEFYFTRFNEKRTIVITEEFMEFNRIRLQGIWKQITNSVLKSNWSPFFCGNFCSVKQHCPLYQAKKGGM